VSKLRVIQGDRLDHPVCVSGVPCWTMDEIVAEIERQEAAHMHSPERAAHVEEIEREMRRNRMRRVIQGGRT